MEAKTTKDKLKVLAKHWKEHNESHIKEYEKWLQKCKEEGLNSEVELLEKIIGKSRELNKFYEKLE